MKKQTMHRGGFSDVQIISNNRDSLLDDYQVDTGFYNQYISSDTESDNEQFEHPTENTRYNLHKKSSLKNRQMSRQYKPQEEVEEVELGNNKIPICSEIKMDNIDISRYEPNPVIHHDIDYAKFALGFHHWIHASKSKTNVFNQYANKKKVYQVVNGYERYIDDYDESIGKVSQKYFENGSQPNILSRAFYKLWEILHYFDLIDDNTKGFTSAHLAEGPGSFIQATMFFREMFAKEAKNDKYYAITLHGDTEDDVKQEAPELEKKFIEYYSKEKPQRLFIHETVSKKMARGTMKDNGDLTSVKTIENFKKEIGTKVDFVTADGGFEWNDENVQEQECSVLILAQILTALNIQKKGGSFVLKVFEMFTTTSAKYIIILKHFYNDVHIVKPLTSRDSNSERYLVCQGFKFEEKQITDILTKLMEVLGKAHDLSENKQIFICDIFPDISIPKDLFVNLLSTNIDISNTQFKVINKIIEYLEGTNFHGEMYSRYRERQITLSQLWNQSFMYKDKDYKKNCDNTRNMLDTAKKIQLNNMTKLGAKLILDMYPNSSNIEDNKKKLSRTKSIKKEKSGSAKKTKTVKKEKSGSAKKTKTVKKEKSGSAKKTKTIKKLKNNE